MTVYVEFQDDRIVEMKTSQQFVVKYKSHENSGVLEDVKSLFTGSGLTPGMPTDAHEAGWKIDV